RRLHTSFSRDWSSDVCSSDLGRAPLIAFFEEFEQVEALLVGQAVGAPVIENEELNTGQFINQLWKAPIEAGHGHVLEEPRHPDKIGRASCRERIVQMVRPAAA